MVDLIVLSENTLYKNDESTKYLFLFEKVKFNFLMSKSVLLLNGKLLILKWQKTKKSNLISSFQKYTMYIISSTWKFIYNPYKSIL